MKYSIRGTGNEVTLTNQHFLAKGGEGSIFARPPLVYKVCEPGKMMPDGKVQELGVLDSPRVIRPKDVLLDSKKKPVGYTMDYVADTTVLCQLFTKAFRKRNGITHDMIWELVRDMEKTTRFIHSKGVLVVDYNELNFLVDKNFKEVYFIDVNSYQTPSYPATAIMESIRDRHCGNKFSELTDWFSFGIVSFQLMIGIHPFKGKHPNFLDPKTSMDERMKANISVLNPAVSYPQGATQPFSVIPDAYMQWYKAIFDGGKRLPPPGVGSGVIIIATPVVQSVGGSNLFTVNELYNFGEEIISIFMHVGKEIVVTDKSVYVDRHKIPNTTADPTMKIGFTPTTLQPVVASADMRQLKLKNLTTGQDLKCSLYADDIMSHDGRLYVRNGSQILEIEFTEIGKNVLVSPKHVGNVLEQAAKVYDGVIVENLFDAMYFSMFPESGICRQIAIRELDGYKIIDAKYEGGLLVVIGVNNKTGEYDRFTFWFDSKWKYQSVVVKDITYTGLNFTVLDNGVVILINEEEKVEIFRVADPTKKKVVDDDAIAADMKLTSSGAKTMFTKGQSLYSFKMN